MSYSFHPLTIDRWPDFEQLFGPKGACAGCWCMWWRMERSIYNDQKGEGNKKSFHDLVKNGTLTGLLAYDGDNAVGWCAVAPRAS